MTNTGILTGKSLFDLAKAFDLSVPDARHIIYSAPDCHLLDGLHIMLPPLYGRDQLSAWIAGSRFGGGGLVSSVFEWLGHTVPSSEF